MITKFQNLLPRKVFGGVALNQIRSKISLRLPKRFQWLITTSFILITFLGYYPTFTIPPVKQSSVSAQTQEQRGEVIATAFSKPLSLPHPGYLSTRFSNWHPGVDIASGLGMPIHPITGGKVSQTGRDFFGLGNFVEVLHENGFRSKYAHMGKIYVKTGEDVEPSNILGEVGLTGQTSGPHTHLEITRNGNYVDPLTLLPPLPNMPAPVFAQQNEPKIAQTKK